jgi:LuxR family glucitol operon transcriptional activator
MVSAVRNTCFAILSAIESDLREAPGDLAINSGTLEILTPDIRQLASQRFDLDNKGRPGIVAENDLDLIEYTDFADLGKMLRLRSADVTAICGKDASELANAIERTTSARNRVCHSRPLEDDDLPRFFDLAKFLISDYDKLGWKHLDSILKNLNDDPSLVFRLSIPSYWRVGAEHILHNLPIPDFDETGFIGRTSEKRDLLKHITGSHPVISVIGEGGVGKSALVLWCLYEVLDSDNIDRFDAIVWVSLKTKILTPTGVEEIRDSIIDTLGIFQTTAEVLGAPTQTSDPEALLKEIRDYMESLKILLIVDNLETISSGSLRPFLGSIPLGSKVLITSRIGLGEIELRYKLDPLDRKQSVSLMRRFAKSINVKLISETSEERLERYCQLLYFNPLLIKWFISSVAAGGDPDRLLTKGNQAFDTALQFCFENLFTRLSSAEQEILYILASARRQLTNAELYFLLEEITNSDQTKLETALNVLHNSSMLKRSVPVSRKADSGTLVALTDVATDYIARFAPPPSKIFDRVKTSLKRLREVTEKTAVQAAAYKYEIFAVRAQSRDERISGMYLNSALELSRAGDIEQSRHMIKKAKNLTPHSAEAYRISALVESKAQELYRASNEIETAVDLNRNSALIHYQYALFLLNEMEDSEHALLEIDAALALDENDDTLLTMRALILTRLGRYKEASDIYEKMLTQLTGRARKWRIATRDQGAECYRRWAEQDRVGLEYELRYAHLNRALEILDEGFNVKDYDRRTGILYSNIIEDALFAAIQERNPIHALEFLARLRDVSFLVEVAPFKRLTFEHFARAFEEDQEFVEATRDFTNNSSIHWASELESVKRLTGEESIEFVDGQVRSLQPGSTFGFIYDFSGKSWFFHQSHLVNRADWIRLTEGSYVRFKAGFNKVGKCAVSVKHVL